MRILALMAFFALQMAVFTCGFDIHVHAMDSDAGHLPEHVQGANDQHGNDSHEQGSTDHGCHVHASHTFTASDASQHKNAPLLSTAQHYSLADLNLKNLPWRIEHPPKLQYS
ncbi:MAG: hypothetical protein JKY87_04020 [Mariprofundus sp.]|nr:hypothetical protein [Mariprofundus sp.]